MKRIIIIATLCLMGIQGSHSQDKGLEIKSMSRGPMGGGPMGGGPGF